MGARQSSMTHKASFLQALEAASVRDRKLALAYREEAELKLALEMSLCQSAHKNGEVSLQDGTCVCGAGSAGSSAGDDGKFEASKIYLLEFSRDPKSYHEALLECDELQCCRKALIAHGFHPELPCGAKVFVPPETFEV